MTFFSPEDVEGYEFLLSVPGYNRAEVRAFLQALAAQLRESGSGSPPVVNHVPEIDREQLQDTKDAVGALIREAEIKMENVANRVVGEFEAVRAEVAQLLRALDLSAQRTRVAESRPPPAETPVAHVPDEDAVVVLDESEETEAIAEPVPEPEFRFTPSEPIELPPEWDDLFTEPRIDPN